MKSILVAVLALTAAPEAGARSQDAREATQPSPKVYRAGSGVSYPTLVRQEQPKYPTDAMRAKIQGVVELEVVVQPDGTVGDVRIVKSLDAVFGLDAQAVSAAKRWRFRPGQLNGQPVPVFMTIILEFRLHENPYTTLLGTSLPDPKKRRTDDPFFQGTYWLERVDLVEPKVKSLMTPRYTTDALRLKIEGRVELDVVVLPNGRVGRARIVESLDRDHGLDAAALKVAASWTFEPGRMRGEPVPVALTVTLEFRLR